MCVCVCVFVCVCVRCATSMLIEAMLLWVMSAVKSALKRCQNGGDEEEEGVARTSCEYPWAAAACGLSLCATCTRTYAHYCVLAPKNY